MKRKLLVVEDDSYISESLKELFESEGYAVECAENGRRALSQLKSGEFRPDVILLDLMMPVQDGYSFREEQRKDPEFQNIPVIVMTANSLYNHRQKDMDARAFLRKPLDIDQVLKAVDRCLDAHILEPMTV